MPRKILVVVILVLLLFSTAVAVYLIKHPQILKSRASGSPIVYVDNSGVKHTDCSNTGTCTTSSTQIKLNVDSTQLDPNGWKSLSSTTDTGFIVGANIASITAYGYQDLKPNAPASDVDADLRELQRMNGSVIRVFVADNQISNDEAARRIGVILDKAATYNISVIPVLIDYLSGPWDRQDMVNAYTNASCSGDSTNVNLNATQAVICNGTKTITWDEMEKELIWVGYSSAHNPQGTDQYYVKQGGFGVLDDNFFTDGYKHEFKDFVTTIINANKSHSNIYAWELGNELRASSVLFLPFAQDMTAYIKSLDPSHKIALGVVSAENTNFAPENLYPNLPNVDLVTIHSYEQDHSGDPDVTWAASHNKISLVEEIGIGHDKNTDVSSKLASEVVHWKSLGAKGVLPWGFIAKGLSDNGDGDSWRGFDAIFHSDYDQIFNVFQSSVSNITPTPVRRCFPNGTCFAGD